MCGGRKGDDVEMLMKITVPKGTPIVVHNAEEMKLLLKQGFRWQTDRIDPDVPLHKYDKEQGIVARHPGKILPGKSK